MSIDVDPLTEGDLVEPQEFIADAGGGHTMKFVVISSIPAPVALTGQQGRSACWRGSRREEVGVVASDLRALISDDCLEMGAWGP